MTPALKRLGIVASFTLAAAGLGMAPADNFKPPEWLKRPTADMLRAVWPTAALKSVDPSGKATIQCKISSQGTLYDCRVLSEEPAGKGFGGAAIAMTPQLLMKPATRGGKPVAGATVTIPVVFKADGPMNTGAGMKRVVAPTSAWKRSPTYAEVAAAYPEKARGKAIGGVVALHCSLDRNGTTKSCRVMREEPKGLGFGAAARDVARLFQTYPSPDGKSLADAAVQISVAFTPDMLRSDTPVVGKPNWAVLPNQQALRDSLALAEPGAAGRVVLQCRVEQGGELSACRVASETPSNLGLGKAALALKDNFRIGTWSMEGLPVVGGLVNIPIRYEAAASAAVAPAKP